jgi:hypothetical protein
VVKARAVCATHAGSAWQLHASSVSGNASRKRLFLRSRLIFSAVKTQCEDVRARAASIERKSIEAGKKVV